MREIIARNCPFTREVWSRDRARDVFQTKGEVFKVELVDAIPEDQDLKIYFQGDWFDLCRGPHMPSTGHIGDAFKLTKLAGAYWRGDSNRQQLQRIYGTAWRDRKDLDAYLRMVEEAEKRDHRRIGREMDLFHLQEEAPGQVFWHAKGWSIWRALEAYMRRRLDAAGYDEVRTPQLIDRKLWEASGHWEKFRENMFLAEVEDEDGADKQIAALKPMNCPGHVQIFNQGIKSYRDLPLRLAEFGSCHRYEPSERCMASCGCAASRRTTRTSSAARTRSPRRPSASARSCRRYTATSASKIPHQVLRPPGQAGRLGRSLGPGGSGADGGDPGRWLCGRTQSG
jgi:threonyl-tRNA synthetase